MFTGIVEEVGRVESRRASRLRVAARRVVHGLRPGDSVAVDGVCLTAVRVDESGFEVDLGPATLQRTTLGQRKAGDLVNLERPVRANGRLGGHLVQGHVDAVGRVKSVQPSGPSRWLEVAAPQEVLRYLVERGSVAVDGVSLTVAGLGPRTFRVCLIPQTLQRTTLGLRGPGDPVNLEVDVLAKYVERLLGGLAR
ncbi:MAG: riboflavin synthase [Armatimonadota bacterium]|nr:riboflavin synthase [Armatimonadota bacterium]MDW8156531.1 riboflavin synthase [Armatimonadota bacterium]